ncbi:MAG: DUF4416 family protein [Candidatus Omnitrophica bacterium]|nr:DUF4416 family protein [Candidatus Omnitrophota bacterium]
MGLIKKAFPVKLIMAMLANKEHFFSEAERLLEKRLSDIDYRSNILNFDYTDYYKEEMGDCILRKFISFRKLITPDRIKDLKIYTNKIENIFRVNKKRALNLDPGYLNEGKVVLASTKDNLQRFYLGKGIYAEITLYLKNENYEHFMWTYPDYRTDEYKKIFKNIREIFRKQIGR